MLRWTTVVALLTFALVAGCSGKSEGSGKSDDERRDLAKAAFKAYAAVQGLCESAENAHAEFSATGKQSLLTRKERELEKAKHNGATLYRNNEIFAQLVDEVHKKAGGEAMPADGSLDYCASKYQVALHNRLMKFR